MTSQRRLQEDVELLAQVLEVSSEELQSTVEELETTNEELQSTNEEFETTNEELQSTNEELESANDELRLRGDELDRVNPFLETVLGTLHVGVIVVDEEHEVPIWNQASEDLWGVRAGEALGTRLMSLDIGLPVEKLREPVDAALSKGESHKSATEAINRRGHTITCRVRTLPLTVTGSSASGAILLVEQLPG